MNTVQTQTVQVQNRPYLSSSDSASHLDHLEHFDQYKFHGEQRDQLESLSPISPLKVRSLNTHKKKPYPLNTGLANSKSTGNIITCSSTSTQVSSDRPSATVLAAGVTPNYYCIPSSGPRSISASAANENSSSSSFSSSSHHYTHAYKNSIISIPPRSPSRKFSNSNKELLVRQNSLQRFQFGLADTPSPTSPPALARDSISTEMSNETFTTSGVPANSRNSLQFQSAIGTVYTNTSVDEALKSFADELSILDSFGQVGGNKPATVQQHDENTNPTNQESHYNLASPQQQQQQQQQQQGELTPISSKASENSNRHQSLTSPASSVDQSEKHYQFTSPQAQIQTAAPPPGKMKKSTSLAGKFRSLTQRRPSPSSQNLAAQAEAKPVIKMKFGSEK